VLALEILEDRTVPSFLAPHDPFVGEAPQAVVTADFNGDGVPDLVTANGYPGGPGVALLLGNGDGTFRPPVSLAGGQHAALVTADFNGDGLPDLAFTNLATSGTTVSVLLGNGDGTFRPAGDFAGDPYSLAVADLNGDGVIDLVNGTRIFLGNGDGTFRLASQISGTGLHVAVADFNGDGKPDLATPISDAGIGLLYLGNGDGTFQSPKTFGVPINGRDAVAAGDFNGDGKADLAVTGTDRVNVLLGKGDGTFQPAKNFNTPSSTTSLAAADFNGDGVLDLVAGGNVLLGKGDGTFQPAQDYFVASDTSDAAVGDFNGDGAPDFVTANAGGATVNVRLNNGDGTFARAPHYGQTDTYYLSMATADVDGNGTLDLVTTRGVLLGNGDGTFQAPVPFNVPGPPLAVAVLDGGQRLAVGQHDRVSILQHVSGGSFQLVASYMVPGGTLSGLLMRMAVADLNGDGIPDLVTTDQHGVNILLGKADGTFEVGSHPRTWNYASSVAVADFDGDGKPDLAVGHGDIVDGYGQRRVMVLRGNGDGTFQDPVEYQVGTGGETPIDVAAVDLNGDGFPDLAVLDAWGGRLILMMNQGDGTFAVGPSLRITGGLESVALAVGDFNNDGIPDLAATGDNGVGILLGHGDGTFDTPLNYGATGLPFTVAAGDFNGDGFTDLATAGDHGAIAVLLNAADWSQRPAGGGVRTGASLLRNPQGAQPHDGNGRQVLQFHVGPQELREPVAVLPVGPDGETGPPVALKMLRSAQQPLQQRAVLPVGPAGLAQGGVAGALDAAFAGVGKAGQEAALFLGAEPELGRPREIALADLDPAFVGDQVFGQGEQVVPGGRVDAARPIVREPAAAAAVGPDAAGVDKDDRHLFDPGLLGQDPLGGVADG
jgi:hypothetical protein